MLARFTFDIHQLILTAKNLEDDIRFVSRARTDCDIVRIHGRSNWMSIIFIIETRGVHRQGKITRSNRTRLRRHVAAGRTT